MNTEIKNRPAKNRNYELSAANGRRKPTTYKSTQAAKLETLRRKTIRQEKYNGGAKRLAKSSETTCRVKITAGKNARCTTKTTEQLRLP